MAETVAQDKTNLGWRKFHHHIMPRSHESQVATPQPNIPLVGWLVGIPKSLKPKTLIEVEEIRQL
jgi:hypothetical protein